MGSGAYLLSAAPARVVIDCRRCDRRGEYSRDRLIARLGSLPMPTVLSAIAKEAGCERALKADYSNPCGVKYAEETVRAMGN